MKYLAPSHVLIGLALQLTMYLAGVMNLAQGAVLCSAIFLMREVTQAEYRWIEAFGQGLRSNMPWYAVLQPRAWNWKSVTDVVVPTITSWAVATNALKGLWPF